MPQGAPPSAADERDRGLGRLRSWTTACVLAAAGLVATLSIVAAESFSGHGTDASAGASDPPSSAASQPAEDRSQDDAPAVQVQPPPGPIGSGRGRRGSVTSGGS